MDRYFICNNPKCRFLLDRRVAGKSALDAQIILKDCPACGGSWSSICPACNGTLAIKIVETLPHISCCDRKQSSKASAA